ncbi:GNAT family N-acetyltransferase [Marisediminicola sp. LYQ134]|uniref:GNAT family N-acetyltransferase n=1 Tax=unclassified Marisediminicola TaxID=2618316 RepID=UPI003983295B
MTDGSAGDTGAGETGARETDAPDPVVRLETERLVLDAVVPSDAPRIAEFCQDPELQRWVPVPQPYTLDHATSFATDYASSSRSGRHPASDGVVLWAIRLEGELAGVIELRLEPVRSATVGFWLARSRRRARLMDEALAAVIDLGFDPTALDLQRIHWQAVAGNVPSAMIARRAGFRFEGTARKSMVHRDERVDAWQASLLRSDPRSRAGGWPL